MLSRVNKKYFASVPTRFRLSGTIDSINTALATIKKSGTDSPNHQFWMLRSSNLSRVLKSKADGSGNFAINTS